MSFIRRLLTNIGFAERRQETRNDAQGLRAFYSTGPEQKKARIKDISATGIYLVTNERWLPGTSVLLTLEKKSLLDRSSRSKVNLPATCVRLSEDGVGLALMQKHVDRATWLEATAKAHALIAKDDLIRVFRMARRLYFCCESLQLLKVGF